MSKFIVLVNSGVYNDSGNVFDREGLEKLFEEWSEGEVLMSDEGEEVSIYELIEVGIMGERINIVNESMVEMGDDYVEVSVVELDIVELDIVELER